MMHHYMAGPTAVSPPPTNKTLPKGAKVPEDYAGRSVSSGRLSAPVLRYTLADVLTLRNKPSVSGKKLGELAYGTKIPDAQFVGVTDDKKYAYGYSKSLGGYFMWMAGDPSLSIDIYTGKISSKWNIYLSSLPPQSVKGFIDPKQLALLMQTDWRAFKPAPKTPKKPLSATTASQEIPLPPKDETLVSKAQEQEVEIEKAGIGPVATVTLTAVIFAAGSFLLSRMR